LGFIARGCTWGGGAIKSLKITKGDGPSCKQERKTKEKKCSLFLTLHGLWENTEWTSRLCKGKKEPYLGKGIEVTKKPLEE